MVGLVRSGSLGSASTSFQPQIFKRCTICTTGLTVSQNAAIRQKIADHGGTFTESFVTSCTCLLAVVINSDKYKAALRLGTPVLRIEWIDDSIEQGQQLPMNGYRLPPLYNLVICVTGFSPEERIDLDKHVQRLGGTYSPDLDNIETHYLIAARPEGAKYEAAVQWGTVEIVNRHWLQACEEQRGCVPAADYPVAQVSHSPPPATRSLHQRTQSLTLQRTTSVPLLRPCSISSISSSTSTSSSTTAGGASSLAKGGNGASSSTSIPTIKPAAAAPSGQVPSAGGGRGGDGGSAAVISSLVLPQALHHMSGGIALIDQEIELTEEAQWCQSVQEASLSTSLGLSGCILYLAGIEHCTKDMQMALYELVRRGAATLANRIQPTVTHIIIAHASFLTGPNIQQLIKLPLSPSIITRDWLLDSIQEKRPLPANASRYSVLTTSTSAAAAAANMRGSGFPSLSAPAYSSAFGGLEGGVGRRREEGDVPPPSMKGLRRSNTFSGPSTKSSSSELRGGMNSRGEGDGEQGEAMMVVKRGGEGPVTKGTSCPPAATPSTSTSCPTPPPRVPAPPAPRRPTLPAAFARPPVQKWKNVKYKASTHLPENGYQGGGGQGAGAGGGGSLSSSKKRPAGLDESVPLVAGSTNILKQIGPSSTSSAPLQSTAFLLPGPLRGRKRRSTLDCGLRNRGKIDSQYNLESQVIGYEGDDD